MDKQNFQIILYVVFGLLIVVGFGSLALYGQLKKAEQERQATPDTVKNSDKNKKVTIIIWGTLDANKVNPLLRQLPKSGFDVITYRQKTPEAIREEYEEAVAYDQRIPDLVLLESREIFDMEPILQAVPFRYSPLVSISDYQQLFVPMANAFLRPGGFLALPVLSDSFVLFYNENLRRQNNIRNLPEVWSDLTEGKYLEVIKKYRNSDTSVIPLGAYSNYTNAPYLFAALAMQAREGGYSGTSAGQLLDFYTNFSNVRSSAYTWNETFLNARSMFVGGRLLFYPGFASEYAGLKRSNPNIVVRAAPLPQVYPDEYAEVVPAKLYALAIVRKGKQFVPALRVVLSMASFVSTNPLNIFDTVTLTPPIRNSIDVTRTPCIKNSQCPSNSCNLKTGTCDLLPPDSRCTSDAQCSSNSCNPITNTCDLVPQRVADEKVFADALFPSKNIPLTPAERTALLGVIQNIVVGTQTPSQAGGFVQGLFR